MIFQRLDQLDLGVGCIDKADPRGFRRQIDRFANMGSADEIAVERDRRFNRGREDANMVEATDNHWAIISGGLLPECKSSNVSSLTSAPFKASARCCWPAISHLPSELHPVLRTPS